jgi:hypothetical protein
LGQRSNLSGNVNGLLIMRLAEARSGNKPTWARRERAAASAWLPQWKHTAADLAHEMKKRVLFVV